MFGQEPRLQLDFLLGNVPEPSPLQEGQLVYHWDLSVRGRHKIHDMWSSVMHQVLGAPKEGGTVYTVAPVSDLSKARQVHRSLLKPVVRESVPMPPVIDQTVAQPFTSCVTRQEEWLGDYDFMVQGRPASRLASESPATGSANYDHSTSSLSAPQVDVSGSPLPGAAVLPGPSDGTAVRARQTSRSTAGQHSNLHHLPRSVC